MMQVDYEQRINMDRMREYRVSRIKQYMDKFDIDCLLLFDTGNKRYSTSTAVCSPEIDNMGRYAIIPRNGPPHIFGFGSEVASEKAQLPVDCGLHVPGTRHDVRRVTGSLGLLRWLPQRPRHGAGQLQTRQEQDPHRCRRHRVADPAGHAG